jgi:hypothetical protein
MPEENKAFFRAEAVQHYTRNSERDVLPRIIAPPVFLCLWLLLGLCCALLVLSWLVRVPIYTSAVGVIQPQATQAKGRAIEPEALLFLPVDAAHPVHIDRGSSVLLHIGSQSMDTTVERVVAGVLSPGEIQRNYELQSGVASLVTSPSMVIAVNLTAAFQAPAYRGSRVSAQVEVRSSRVLSLFATVIGA